MLTLAIETSGSVGSVALSRDGTLIESLELERAGRRHAQTLIVTIRALLERAGISARDCNLVAVSIGPGSFTGLRVGVVCAKTFAYATGCQVVAIDTFEAVAAASPAAVDVLYVIDDAQRGDLYVGRYVRRDDGAFRRDGSIDMTNAESWCRRRSTGDCISGPGVERFEGYLPAGVRCLPPEYRFPTARSVARLAERRVAEGETADFWALEPLYLRKSTAEEKWEASEGTVPK